MLLECAKNYGDLLGKKCLYTISKGKNVTTLEIRFLKENFFHAVGLHKLSDLAPLFKKRKANNVFNKILTDDKFRSKIENSDNYNYIINRIRIMNDIERILLEKTKIYKYPYNANVASNVVADYLVQFKYFTKQSYLPIINCGNHFVVSSILYDDNRKLASDHQKYRVTRQQILPID